MRLIKYLLSTLIFSGLAAWSLEPITMSLDSDQINFGEPIIVSFVINDPGIKNINFPQNSPDYQVIGNSTNTSIEIINGKLSQKKIIQLLIQALHPGQILIPSATATVGGNTYTTEAKNVIVSATNQKQIINLELERGNSPKPFVRMSVDNPNLYLNQRTVLRVKVYHLGNIKSLNIPLVKLNDFLQIPNKKALEYKEIHQGKEYLVYETNYLICPARSGLLKIPEYTIDAVIVEEKANETFDPFLSVFGGLYTEKPIQLHSDPIMLNVKSLPKPSPQGFLGYVGSLNIRHSIDKKEIKAGEAVIIKSLIKGNGNSKNISEDLVEKSSQYSLVKDNENVEENSNGFTKTIYTAVFPDKNIGKVKIKTKPICIFDRGIYRSIGEQEFEINVIAGEPNTRIKDTRMPKPLEDKVLPVSNKEKILYLKPIENYLFIIIFLLNFLLLCLHFRKYLNSREWQKWKYTKSIKEARSIPEISKIIKEILQKEKLKSDLELESKLQNFLLETDQYNYGMGLGTSFEDIKNRAIILSEEIKNESNRNN